jgi:hypothetical protein
VLNPNELGVKTYQGRRFYVASVETAAFAFPAIVIYFVCVRLFFAANTSSDKKQALIGFLLVLILLALVATYSARIMVTSIRSSRELIVKNVWRSYRIPWSSIRGMTVTHYAIVRGIGPRLPVVEISYVEDADLKEQKVMVLASFNAGKNSDLLDELEAVGKELSIACDLSRLIY